MIRVNGQGGFGRLQRGSGRRIRIGAAVGVLLIALCSGGAIEAAEAEPEWGYALAHELMSPYCPGRTLAACPSEQAAEVRQWILLQEAAGATREEVIANLEIRFGEQIHSAPEARGWGLAAWGLPAGALALGALVVVWVLRRMVKGQGRSSPSPAPGVGNRGAQDGDTRAQDAELERLVDAEFSASER